jgi:hypothetical protein
VRFFSCANVSYPAAKTIKQLDFYASHSTSTSHSLPSGRLEGTECLHLENFYNPIQDKTTFENLERFIFCSF